MKVIVSHLKIGKSSIQVNHFIQILINNIIKYNSANEQPHILVEEEDAKDESFETQNNEEKSVIEIVLGLQNEIKQLKQVCIKSNYDQFNLLIHQF